MGKDYWYEEENPDRLTRRLSYRVIGWGILVTVMVLLIGAGIWALKVGTSDVKGRGDAVVIKNNGQNLVQVQETFNKLYQDIKQTDLKINDAAALYHSDPKNVVLQTNYQGLVNYCRSVVGQYNSDARSYTKEDFRDADLPSEITDTDPTTDCKEDIK